MLGLTGDVLVLDGLFGPEELGLLSGVANALAFEPQDLGRGMIGRRSRATTEDERVPTLLWDGLAPVLPPLAELIALEPGRPGLDPPVDRWTPVGCNPRTRFYRYERGASFSEHADEPWKPDPHTRSFLTVLVYLPAGGCVGGETVIDGTVVPVVDGRVVAFDHRLPHEGKPVEQGQKLTLRSDVVASTDP